MKLARFITMAFGALATLSGCANLPEDEAGEAVSEASAPSCTAARAFTHAATTASVHGHATAIDDPSANGRPDAILTVTPNWTPNGGAYTPSYHPIGVWYDLATARWNVYNADNTPMPVGTGFNVRVGGGFVVRSPNVVSNVNGFSLPHPSPAPDAMLFVTPS